MSYSRQLVEALVKEHARAEDVREPVVEKIATFSIVAVDPETGVELPRGEKGEIAVRGVTTMRDVGGATPARWPTAMRWTSGASPTWSQGAVWPCVPR